MGIEKALTICKRRPVSFHLGGFEGAVRATVDTLAQERFCERLWEKDATLWVQEPEARKLIASSLGWLTVWQRMAEETDSFNKFAREIKNDGFEHLVLLGMGGSSLASEVFRNVFGHIHDYPRLVVLDSTDPLAVRRVAEAIDPEKTLFIVSSKSGTTIEPLCLLDYFYDTLKDLDPAARGKHFIAITEAGTPLEKLAARLKFRRVFLNPPDIGGRFSVLSYFGLVPAALAGIDVSRLLHEAVRMERCCGKDITAEENPAVFLGAALGELALQGRDKVTFLIDEEVSAFGLWLEQLIAESTGKRGVGIVPIAGERVRAGALDKADRVFVYIGDHKGTPQAPELLEGLIRAGHPLITVEVAEPYALGGEFLRWEIAVAAAGSVMRINPFDQPDVEVAKNLTRKLLSGEGGGGAQQGGAVPIEPAYETSAFVLNFSLEVSEGTPEQAMAGFLNLIKEGDYVALLAYFDSEGEGVHEAFADIRGALGNALGVATQLGFGPRYLHSIGQLHKGGPDSGVFFILTHARTEDVSIPDRDYTFYDLQLSQAMGDFQALRQKGRRTVLVSLKGEPEDSLKGFSSFLIEAL